MPASRPVTDLLRKGIAVDTNKARNCNLKNLKALNQSMKRYERQGVIVIFKIPHLLGVRVQVSLQAPTS